jgi:hypothetical protein
LGKSSLLGKALHSTLMAMPRYSLRTLIVVMLLGGPGFSSRSDG